MDREEALARLSGAQVGHLATSDPGGIPHTSPVVFAVSGPTIYWAVDDKPKRATELKRIRNIRTNPNVQLVVDHYEEDWAALWWIRATGTARIVDGTDEAALAAELLAAKYPPYAERPPGGPLVAIDVARLTWWVGGPSPRSGD